MNKKLVFIVIQKLSKRMGFLMASRGINVLFVEGNF
jgi:hypothetical protein